MVDFMTMNIIKRIFYGICMVVVLGMLFFGYEAYDKKNNYYNSEYATSLNENAYVGGDAYNYIINAGYFAGYASLCGACAITATISFGAGTLLEVIEKKKDIYIVREADQQKFLGAKASNLSNT